MVNKLVTNAQDNVADLKREIKTDISMSLVKSRVQGLRSNRNGISSQISNFRTPITNTRTAPIITHITDV